MYRRLAEELLDSMSGKQPPFEESGWTRGEAAILRCLCGDREGELRQLTSGELSRRVNLSTGRVATALKSLESKGFIVRSYDRADKRRVMVGATPDGAAMARQVHTRILRNTERLLCRLGEEDAAELVRLIKRVLEQKPQAAGLEAEQKEIKV